MMQYEGWTQNNSWLFIKVQYRSCLINQLHTGQKQKHILVYFIIFHTRLEDRAVSFLWLETWAICCINLVRHQVKETQEDPSSISQCRRAAKTAIPYRQDNWFSRGSENKMFIKRSAGAGGTAQLRDALLWQRTWVHSSGPLSSCSQLSVTMASAGSTASGLCRPPCSCAHMHTQTRSKM